MEESLLINWTAWFTIWIPSGSLGKTLFIKAGCLVWFCTSLATLIKCKKRIVSSQGEDHGISSLLYRPNTEILRRLKNQVYANITIPSIILLIFCTTCIAGRSRFCVRGRYRFHCNQKYLAHTSRWAQSRYRFRGGTSNNAGHHP